MNRETFKAELANLIKELISTIGDEYRSDDPDAEPGMQLTIGVDEKGWNYQTGDTSYTGGAYGYANWGITYLRRDTVPEDAAEDVLSDLESTVDELAVFFYDEEEQS